MATSVEVLKPEAGIALPVTRIGGAGNGLHVAILAGVHGDEIEGVLSAQRLINELETTPLFGSVSILPTSNPTALGPGTRMGADDDNLARMFPGTPNGRVTQRIAHAITEHVIRGSDLLIDLHAAGRRYRMPALIGLRSGATIGGRLLLDIAMNAGFPHIWEHGVVEPGRSISAADALGIPWYYVESGGGGSLLGADVDLYVAGVLHILSSIGVLDLDTTSRVPGSASPRIIRDGSGDTDSGVLVEQEGYLLSRTEVGRDVARGELLGAVHGLDGALLQEIRSPESGLVMMLRHDCVVKPGDVAAIVVRGNE